jgi:dolichol-phosphate mannosyltransferase
MSVIISIVVPVYKEEKSISDFLCRLRPIISNLTEDYEIIFSLDPSPDRTMECILQQRAGDSRIKLIKFSRRFGQPMAILAGLQYSSGKAVIVMDVDLQDPPELVSEMVALWRGGYDVVMAQRRSRDGETLLKKLITKIGYSVIRRISEVPIPPNTGEFRLLSRRVVDEVLKLSECHGFLRGLVALVGFRQTTILFDRPGRKHGLGNYNRFLGSLRIGFNGIFCFSTYTLSLSTMLGFGIACLSFLIALIYLFMKLFGFPFPLGNPTVVILVLLMGGIQLISVGILGEYIGRIYEEVRRRPKFIVDDTIGFKE